MSAERGVGLAGPRTAHGPVSQWPGPRLASHPSAYMVPVRAWGRVTGREPETWTPSLESLSLLPPGSV